MGKKIKGWKRRKNKIFEDFTLLTVPKDSIWLLQHYFTLFWPYLYYIYTLWGRKSNNFSTRRGRKSKTRGGKEIKGRSTLYTPGKRMKLLVHRWGRRRRRRRWCERFCSRFRWLRGSGRCWPRCWRRRRWRPMTPTTPMLMTKLRTASTSLTMQFLKPSLKSSIQVAIRLIYHLTSHPRIAHGQRYPMPCLEWSSRWVVLEQGSGPKGPMSCKTQGWIFWHDFRPLGANLRLWGLIYY